MHPLYPLLNQLMILGTKDFYRPGAEQLVRHGFDAYACTEFGASGSERKDYGRIGNRTIASVRPLRKRTANSQRRHGIPCYLIQRYHLFSDDLELHASFGSGNKVGCGSRVCRSENG